MRRFLIVGCGGSGGATIRFIQDQLRADLRAEGTHELPDAWQFVHIDVPTTPDSGPAPLGSVRDMGGRYLSVSSVGNTYERSSTQMFHSLGGRLDTTLGWAPDPADPSPPPPVENGAGQYRAVGRVLTLTRLNDLKRVLEAAYEDLQKPDPWIGVSPARRAKAAASRDTAVVPIVIGSMAGGSGASMFLDVCRMVGRLVDPKNIGAFLYTSDVFRSLPESLRTNIEGNALGAIGDIIAAQTGLSTQADLEILEALGVGDAQREPFARVFPIGAAIGGDGAIFGDGTPFGIYRGIGRALAALVLSDVQQPYVDYILGNPGALQVSTDVFGWGADAKEVAWGSFGYASLSLGRDRYAEYAAQRLARAAADRLMSGHMDPGVHHARSGEQLKDKVDSQWSRTLGRLGLPQPGEDIGAWFRTTALTNDFVVQESRRVVSEAISMVNGTESQPAGDWFNTVTSRLPHYREPVRDGLARSAYVWTERFGTALEEKVLAEFLDGAKRLGLPYAREILDRIRAHLEIIVNHLQDAPDPASFDPLALDPTLGTKVQAMKRALVAAGHDIANAVVGDVARSAGRVLQTASARSAARLLDSFRADVLVPLAEEASNALRNLEASRDSTAVEAGLAQLRSTIYREWPDGTDVVPPRFAHAENEILLTTASSFPHLYEDHVVRTVGEGSPLVDSQSEVVGQIIRGRWKTEGGAPGDIPVVHHRASWRAGVLAVSSETGDPTPRSRAAYSLALGPADILERSRLYLERPNEPFADYRNETVKGYLNDTFIPTSALGERKLEFAEKFLEAMRLARPLVGVSPAMVGAVHYGEALSYDYIFTNIGLAVGDAAVSRIRDSIVADPTLPASVVTALDKACEKDATDSRIALFGFYPKYSPVVFNSLLGPVKDRFATIADSSRPGLWRWKSTRPLQASVPMSAAELHALIGGWYVGLLTGQVRPGTRDQPSAVWDPQAGRWLAFPWPLLTQPSAVASMDRLAITIESFTLALVNADGETDLRSLLPFRALRRIWDDTPDRPVSQAVLESLRVRSVVSGWLQDGQVQGGDVSLAVPTAPSLQPEERRSAATTWVTQVQGVVNGLLVAGTGANYGQTLPQVPDVRSVFTRPRLAAVAPLVASVLDEIAQVIISAPVGADGAFGSDFDGPVM